jgi:hypothetical protein
MLGGNRYATWHSFEADPSKVSAVAGAKFLVSSGNEVHLVFNPVSGQVVQLLPGNRAGRGLMNVPGGVQTNRAGVVNLQVEVVGFAKNPWTGQLTGEGRKGLARILAWMDSWGVPRATPAGAPAATAAGPHRRIAPGPSGHYTHSQWKENEHWDHGAVPWADLFAALPGTVPLGGLPKPAPVPVHQPAPPAGRYTKDNVIALQRAVRVAPDGDWGPHTDQVAGNFRNAAFPTGRFDVRTVQAAVGAATDGVMGPQTRAAIIITTRQVQKALLVGVDGDWGPATDQGFFTLRKKFHG